MNKNIFEYSIIFILLALLFCFLNPFGWWMPTSIHMTLLALFIVLFGMFVLFVWKESFTDEREQLHGLLSARIAYLSGALMLVVGITVEAFTHVVDPWLSLSLGVMIIAKIVTRWWAQKCH